MGTFLGAHFILRVGGLADADDSWGFMPYGLAS